MDVLHGKTTLSERSVAESFARLRSGRGGWIKSGASEPLSTSSKRGTTFHGRQQPTTWATYAPCCRGLMHSGCSRYVYTLHDHRPMVPSLSRHEPQKTRVHRPMRLRMCTCQTILPAGIYAEASTASLQLAWMDSRPFESTLAKVRLSLW